MAMYTAAAFIAPESHAQFRAPDIEIELDQFGLGGQFLPGTIVPMRLVLTNSPAGSLDEVVSTWVQWEVPNADGDVGEYGRPITLQRGQRIPLWLYAPVPPGSHSNSIWTVRVFEYTDGERRHEIGGRRIQPADFSSISRDMPLNSTPIGVVGSRWIGLNHYHPVREEAVPFNGPTFVVRGLRTDRLPDRWEGLSPFEAIVWADAPPQELTADTAGALREYVRFGGHLIIVLPEDANPWQFGGRAQTPLSDILPQQEPRRDLAVPISETLPILSKSRHLPSDVPDFPLGVRVFKAIGVEDGFNSIDPPYEPLLALPDGRVIAVQRTFGHGRITIIGLDVSQTRLASVGLPHADVFWNRILGRRVDTPSGNELQTLIDERMLIAARSASTVHAIGSGPLILQQISMDTTAGLGLMLALLLFCTYWALAGPGGFALLKLYKRTHHAWIAFAAAAAAFTAVAWGAVGLMRVNEPLVEHITYLDHIARPHDVSRPEDPQLQRAVSWFSLYTPGYNNTPVTIESEPGRRNILSSWTPPQHDQTAFPNAHRFRVSVADTPNSVAIPSRQTSTLMKAHWMGGLDPEWGGMIRESISDPIRVIYDGAGQEMGIAGRLTHDLNGRLRDVTVIWVRNLRLANRQFALRDGEEQAWVPLLQSGEMSNSGYAWRVSEWQAGQSIDLSDRSFETLGTAVLRRAIDERYIDPYRRSSVTAPGTPLTREQQRRHLEMLGIFNQLAPPQYFRIGSDDRDPAIFHRHLAREIDLSPWFTRPCLIVMGFLEESEIPVPIRVGDARPVSNGTTIVRWIYPLPLIEDIAFRQPASEEEWPE